MEFPKHFDRQSGVRGGRPVAAENVPAKTVARFADFSGGYIPAIGRTEIPDSASPYARNIEVTKGNRLKRAPGTTLMVDFEDRAPSLMALHGSLDFTAEIVFFDPPYFGVLGAGVDVVWEDKDLATDLSRYAWTNFGGTFIFTDGVKVFARQSNDGTNLTEEATIPVARAYGSHAGRLFAGAPIFEGKFEPMMQMWSAANSDYRDFTGEGASFELLINEIAAGDRIMCNRPMGLDFMAVMLRNSIWIGTRTGQVSSPEEFRPRVTGIGTVNEPTCRATPKGIIFLSDDGVRIFDGGIEAPGISEQINNELLPLDYENINKYRAAFDPTNSRYILHTPDKTWVYELDKQRWFLRELVALDSVLRPEQTGGLAWEDAEGDWTSQGPLAWFDLVGGSEGKANLILLGDNAFTTTRTLEREDPASSKFFSNDFTGTWEFKASKQQLGNYLLTVKQFNLEVYGEADFEIWTPGINGAYEQLIASSFSKNVLDIHEVHEFFTGRLAGLRLLLGPGIAEVAAVEVLAQIRGPRFPDSGPFDPPDVGGDLEMPVRNRSPISIANAVVVCFEAELEGSEVVADATCSTTTTKKRWRKKRDGEVVEEIISDEPTLESDFDCEAPWNGEDSEFPHGLLFVFAEKGMGGFGKTGLFDPRQTQGGRRTKGYGQERRSGGKGGEAIFGGHGGASGAPGSDGESAPLNVLGDHDVTGSETINWALEYPLCPEDYDEDPETELPPMPDVSGCPSSHEVEYTTHVVKGAVNLALPNDAAYWGGTNFQEIEGDELGTKNAPVPVAMNAGYNRADYGSPSGCPEYVQVSNARESADDCGPVGPLGYLFSEAEAPRFQAGPYKVQNDEFHPLHPLEYVPLGGNLPWGMAGGPSDSRGAGGAGLPPGAVGVWIGLGFGLYEFQLIDFATFDGLAFPGRHPVGVGGRGLVKFTYNASWDEGNLVSEFFRPDIWNEDKEFTFDCAENIVPGTPVTIECWGGGGSGGVGLLAELQASGGGGGAYSKTTFNNMTDQELLVHIGAGGVAVWDALLEEFIIQNGGDSWVKEINDAMAPEVPEDCGELELCLSLQPPEWEAEDKWTEEICKALN